MEYIASEISLANPATEHFKVNITRSLNRSNLTHWFTARHRYQLPVSKELIGQDVIQIIPQDQDEIDYLLEHLVFHVAQHHTHEFDIMAGPGADTYVYGVVQTEDGEIYLYKLADNAKFPPLDMGDKFTITNKDISNYFSKEPLVTDVGKFLLNYLLLAHPFKNLIPYINKQFKASELDDTVAKLIINGEATREMFNTYMNNGYWYGMDGSLATPTWTEKSLSTSREVLKRRAELLEEYKDQLDDPAVTAKIEAELIAMDKEYIKGDKVEVFYGVNPGKAYTEQRKKNYIMVGTIPAFGKPGQYEFIPDSQETGWRLDQTDIMANEIRRGIFGRSKETAKGGEESKFVMRIFQNVKITQDDCKTKEGIPLHVTASNYDNYIDRYLITGEILTEEDKDKYVGKIVHLRAPQYCKTPDGFCYKCCGSKIEKLRFKHAALANIETSSTMLSVAMKAMHVTSIKTTEISDINKYFIAI